MKYNIMYKYVTILFNISETKLQKSSFLVIIIQNISIIVSIIGNTIINGNLLLINYSRRSNYSDYN